MIAKKNFLVSAEMTASFNSLILAWLHTDKLDFHMSLMQENDRSLEPDGSILDLNSGFVAGQAIQNDSKCIDEIKNEDPLHAASSTPSDFLP